MGELYGLPEGWEWKKLEEVCQFINGKAYKKVELLSEGKYPVLRVGNFFTNNNWYYSDLELPENKYCDYGDLLYAWSASFGPRIWEGKKSIYHYHIWKIIPDDKLITKEFLYQLLDWDVEKIKSDQGTGTTMMHVTKGSMEARIIPLPPLQEQKRIVAKLDSLFAKIDQAIVLHQQNIDEAEGFMGSVLNEVFGELEERYGLIQINEIIQKTKNLKPTDEEERYFTYIDISSINNENFTIESPKKLLEKEAPSRAKKEVILGDIVYATTRPNLKNIALVEQEYDNPVASTGFCILRVNNMAINSYLFYYLLTNKLYEQIEPNIRGAQYPATSDKDLKNCYIPNTPKRNQQKTVQYLDQLSQKTETLKQVQTQKMESLKALKASLLDRAFRGEL